MSLSLSPEGSLAASGQEPTVYRESWKRFLSHFYPKNIKSKYSNVHPCLVASQLCLSYFIPFNKLFPYCYGQRFSASHSHQVVKVGQLWCWREGEERQGEETQRGGPFNNQGGSCQAFHTARLTHASYVLTCCLCFPPEDRNDNIFVPQDSPLQFLSFGDINL